MNLTYVLLDIDPNIVRPGWIAALVTVFLLAALGLLFFSLRKQVGRISPDLPYASKDDGADNPPSAPDITGKKG